MNTTMQPTPAWTDAQLHAQGWRRFTINGFRYIARERVDGVLINPVLPHGFENTPHDQRRGHEPFWYLPFVVTRSVDELDAAYARNDGVYAKEARAFWLHKYRTEWMKAWPSGTRYEVRCLDGGAWDRATSWGMFATLAEAIHCAKTTAAEGGRDEWAAS